MRRRVKGQFKRCPKTATIVRQAASCSCGGRGHPAQLASAAPAVLYLPTQPAASPRVLRPPGPVHPRGRCDPKTIFEGAAPLVCSRQQEPLQSLSAPQLLDAAGPRPCWAPCFCHSKGHGLQHSWVEAVKESSSARTLPQKQAGT